jgi:hypothetical protein
MKPSEFNWQSLYDKVTDPCCPKCEEESDALLRQYSHLFNYGDIRLILQERSRIVAMKVGRAESVHLMKRVVKPILVRMGVSVTW